MQTLLYTLIAMSVVIIVLLVILIILTSVIISRCNRVDRLIGPIFTHTYKLFRFVNELPSNSTTPDDSKSCNSGEEESKEIIGYLAVYK